MRFQKFLIGVLIVLVSAGHHAASQNVVAVAASMRAPVTAQEAGVRVSGHLFTVEGMPFDIPNVRAVLLLGNGVAGVSNIGTDGFFEFAGISPGSYSLSLTGTGVPLSPILPVRVANTAVRDIEMVAPRPKQVSGQVTLEGNGPLPVVRLLLKPVKDLAANPAVRALSPSGFVTNDSFPGLVPIAPILELNPRSDGTILVRIPEGDWYVSVSSGLPAGYSIRALTYGTADILKGPLKVRLSENAAIRLVVANAAPRLSKVYGRITGLTPALIAMGAMNVTLSGPLNQRGPIPSINTQQRAAMVRADGTFEIDEVLPGDYSAMVTGFDTIALAVAKLSVENAEVRNVELAVNRSEIHGQVIVEGGPMVSTLTLGFREVQEPGTIPGTVNIVSMKIRPLPDGTFTAALPAQEQLINNGYGSSCGYKLKSMIYGATDVMRIPLKIVKADAFPLQITLTYSECARR